MTSRLRNPIDTEDQRAVERRALELFEHPRIVSTVKEIREYWLKSVPRSPDMLSCFDRAFEEVMFAAIVWFLAVGAGYVLIVPGLILHVFCIFSAASAARQVGAPPPRYQLPAARAA